MEKISRILPPSARTKNYDVARAQPARPGAPTAGRPQNMDAIEDRMTLSEQYLAPILNGDTLPSGGAKTDALTQTYKPKESVKYQVVKEMSEKFFANQNPKSIARDSGQTQTEEIASRVQSSTGSNVYPDSSSDINL